MDGKRGQANGRVVNEPSRTEAGMTGHDESLGADLSGRPSVCFLFVFFLGRARRTFWRSSLAVDSRFGSHFYWVSGTFSVDGSRSSSLNLSGFLRPFFSTARYYVALTISSL